MVIHDSSEGRDVLQVGALTALVRLLRIAALLPVLPLQKAKEQAALTGELWLQGWLRPTQRDANTRGWSSRGNEQTPSSVQNNVQPIQRISREQTSLENNNPGSAGRGDCANNPLLYTKKAAGMLTCHLAQRSLQSQREQRQIHRGTLMGQHGQRPGLLVFTVGRPITAG